MTYDTASGPMAWFSPPVIIEPPPPPEEPPMDKFWLQLGAVAGLGVVAWMISR